MKIRPSCGRRWFLNGSGYTLRAWPEAVRPCVPLRAPRRYPSAPWPYWVLAIGVSLGAGWLWGWVLYRIVKALAMQ